MAQSRAAQLVTTLVFALSLSTSTGGCSVLVDHHNAGIGVFEDGPAPARDAAVGAKYAGWILGAPLAVALTPVALLAWATPWVDLPMTVDMVTAPSLGLGYAVEAAVGAPVYAACWALGLDEDAPVAEEEGSRSAAVRRAGRVPTAVAPWGLVVDHRRRQIPSRGPTPPPPDLAAYYAVPPEVEARLGSAVAACFGKGTDGSLDPVSLRLEGEPGGALELTLAAAPGSRPLVLMSPPTQGLFAARYLARRYARRGVHAAVIVPDKVFLEPALDAVAIERKLRGAVVQGRAVVRCLSRRPEVRGSRVSYLGISAGGIFGVMLCALEPRVERAALIFPGGDLPALVAQSDESTVVAYREAWAARGVDRVALSASFVREVRTEPLRLAPYVDPRRVLLFLSASDTRVPITGGLSVERRLGNPETYVLAGNHQTSGICFGFVLRRADRFLLASR